MCPYKSTKNYDCSFNWELIIIVPVVSSHKNKLDDKTKEIVSLWRTKGLDNRYFEGLEDYKIKCKDDELDKRLNNCKMWLYCSLVFLRLDHVSSPNPGWNYICLITKNFVIKSYDLVIIIEILTKNRIICALLYSLINISGMIKLSAYIKLKK